MRPFVLACLCAAALSAAGCASDVKDSFYTLAPAGAVLHAAAPDSHSAFSVAVGPVQVPAIVDRPEFVVRQGGNRVDVLEQQRWAQPLRAEIAQALVADLGSRLPQARVLPGGDTGSQDADYRASFDVTRFDAFPGDAVVVRGVWTVHELNGDRRASGQADVREPVRGAGYDAVAAAYSRAIDRVGATLADAISALRAGAH